MTLVSIIIPTKNSAKTIDACLKSINNQTYQNIEIIVVDKFSYDETIDIVKKYDVKLFHSHLNKPGARNFGAKQSNGDFILHLDCDMELENDVVEECIKDCSGTDAIYIPETNKGKNFLDKCRRLEKNIYVNDSNVEAARFIKREIFENLHGFDKEFDGLDEYAFHARLEKNTIKISRINSYILINEDLSLKKILYRKFYRGQELKEFKNKYPKDAKNRFSIIRLKSYINNIDTLFSYPLYSTGMFSLKFLEMLSFYIGALFPRRKIKHIRDKFDVESPNYEQNMYLNTIGSRFVDKIEKEIVLSEFINGRDILDLGIGTGRWSREFVKLGYNVTGIDISDKMLKVARDNVLSDKFAIINSDMEFLPFRDEKFDMINCVRSVKYVKNHRGAISEMNRVLKKDGILVIEISNKSLFITPLYHISKILQISNLNNGIFNHLSHIRIFSKNEIKKELELCRFQIVKIKPIFIISATVCSKIDNRFTFSIINLFERILSSIIPLYIFSRGFVVVARKV